MIKRAREAHDEWKEKKTMAKSKSSKRGSMQVAKPLERATKAAQNPGRGAKRHKNQLGTVIGHKRRI